MRVSLALVGALALVGCSGGGGSGKDAPTSDAPSVEIWSHTVGDRVLEDKPITYGGTATDDGPIDELVATWFFDGEPECTGPLDEYDNSTCEWTAPAGFDGVTVRLEVTDAGGATGSAEVSLSPFVNEPPKLRIEEPRTGPWHANVPVVFDALARDPGTNPGEMHVTWESSLDGPLPEVDGTLDPEGRCVGEALLTEGTHVITASVTDVSNATTTTEVTIDVGPPVP